MDRGAREISLGSVCSASHRGAQGVGAAAGSKQSIRHHSAARLCSPLGWHRSAICAGNRRRVLDALEKRGVEFIENAFNSLLQSRPDPLTADKIADLRDRFRDAYAGWLEIEEAA